MYGYIYLTTNKINGKKYIGQHAKSEFDKTYYGSGTAFNLAFQKYGKENSTSEILDWAETKEELDQLEIEWIAKSKAVESEEYYNITIGGEAPMSGRKHSEESKQKMSESHKGKQVGENHPMWGKHWSEETKHKISISLTGRNLTEETRKKISKNNYMRGRTGELNPMFGKTRELNPMWGKHHTEEAKKKISEKVSGENNPNYGRTGEKHPMFDKTGELNPFYGKTHSEKSKRRMKESWDYDKHFSEKTRKKLSESHSRENNPRCKPVVQLTISGELVQQYQYVKQVKQFGFSKPEDVSACCKGKKETYKGFRWMYLEDWNKLNSEMIQY